MIRIGKADLHNPYSINHAGSDSFPDGTVDTGFRHGIRPANDRYVMSPLHQPPTHLVRAGAGATLRGREVLVKIENSHFFSKTAGRSVKPLTTEPAVSVPKVIRKIRRSAVTVKPFGEDSICTGMGEKSEIKVML